MRVGQENNDVEINVNLLQLRVLYFSLLNFNICYFSAVIPALKNYYFIVPLIRTEFIGPLRKMSGALLNFVGGQFVLGKQYPNGCQSRN